MIQAVKSLQTSPTQKLLLLVLADCHNEKTGQCNPSYRYLMEISGLSNKAVANNLKALRNSGSVTFDSRNGANTYYELTPERFNPVNLVHQFESESSEPRSPVNLVTSEPSSQGPVNLVPSTSEPRSKSSERGSHKPERTGNRTGSEPLKKTANKTKSPKTTDEDWLALLKSSSEYAGINIDFEFRRASEWISKKSGRQMTRRFFTNWLDRCEKPLAIKPKPQNFTMRSCLNDRLVIGQSCL